MRQLIFVFLVIALVGAGCSSDDGSGEDDSVERQSTPVVNPTATPQPTVTPEPIATPTPAPTPTPSPTPQPEPTPEPTPLPERASLTGEPAAERLPRPIAVRIDNSPNARPHSGLAKADLVYEAPTEASVTRFLALYQTSAPEVVGPSRSARLMDLEVVPLHDAILAYSGASIGVQERLLAHGLALLGLEGNANAASWRDDSRYAPHNLYTSISALRDIASNHGWMRAAENVPFTYGELPEGGLPGTGVNIPYSSGFVEYRYNPDTASYDRIVEGVEARDRETDQIVSPRNVVVIWANFYTGDVAPNTRGEISNNVELRGGGQAWILREGHRFEVEWRRNELTEPFRFFSRETGEEIALSEGKTWINLVPPEVAPTAVD